MSLSPPATVGKLQAALHTKAKEAPGYRFYALYDKVYRADVLAHAYERCRAHGGAAGVDGQTFADIEAYGTQQWLEALAQELKGKTYRPPVPAETFTFLGFTFGPQTSWKTGRVYVTPTPATPKVQGICNRISQATRGSTTWRDVAEEVGQLNQLLVGWANYFRLGYVTAAWQVVQQHACRRLRWWLRRKHRAKSGRGQRYPDMQLYERYGLVQLVRTVRRLPLWA